MPRQMAWFYVTTGNQWYLHSHTKQEKWHVGFHSLFDHLSSRDGSHPKRWFPLRQLPVNARRWPSIVLMLGQRHRRWSNIKPTLVYVHVCMRPWLGLHLRTVCVNSRLFQRWIINAPHPLLSQLCPGIESLPSAFRRDAQSTNNHSSSVLSHV